MNDLNAVTVEGRLTRDPEVKYTGAGTAVGKLSIACNRSYKKDDKWVEEVSYVDVTVWAKTAEYVNEHLKKGMAVLLSGYLKQDRWEQDGQQRSKLGVVAQDVRILAARKSAEAEEEIPI